MLYVIILTSKDVVCLIQLLDASANSSLMLSCSVNDLVIFIVSSFCWGIICESVMRLNFRDYSFYLYLLLPSAWEAIILVWDHFKFLWLKIVSE